MVAAVFLGTLVRSAFGFGFGEALVAVPLLALIIPVLVAVPGAALLSITVAGLILAQDWGKVHARSASLWLTFGSSRTPTETQEGKVTSRTCSALG